MMTRYCMIVFLLILSGQGYAQTLKIATVSPDGTPWMQELRLGAEKVKKRTDGRIKFRFYPGGVMGNDKSVLRKMRIGQLHGGAITGGGLQEIYTDSQVYSLPFLFRDYAEVDYVRKRMDKLIIQGLYNKGYASFGLGEGGFAYLMSDKPIYGSEDLKGQKVWVPDGDVISRAMFEAIDVSPIPLPLPDVLTGLQTGLVNTVGASPVGAIALQWHTRVKYVTDTPLMYLYGIMIVDRKAFEKMNASDQQIVREEMQNVFLKINEINREDNENARQALMDQGISFIKSSVDSRDFWSETVDKVVKKLSDDNYISNNILEKIYGYLDEYRSSQHEP